MKKRMSVLIVFWLVLILMISSLTVLNSGGSRAGVVNYTMEITDPSGDAGTGSDTINKDGDILKINSVKDGDNIKITMQVTGTIYTTYAEHSSLYTLLGYVFHIDIMGDFEEDWEVTVRPANSLYGYNTSVLTDDKSTHTIYLPNATKDGANKLIVLIPISIITDIEPIYSWNLWAETSIVSSSGSVTDKAPDSADYPVDESADNDGDGMPNYYEADKNFDPNNASDADADEDDDNYTNKEEYDAGTNPYDKCDKPGANKLSITILKPKENEVIPPGGIGSVYTMRGTATAKYGDPIDHIDYRNPDALVTDWQNCYDNGTDCQDYSEWYAEIESHKLMGVSPMFNEGKNTIEVKAYTESEENITVSVIVYFGSGAPEDDTDADGMPDDYEDANGLDKNDFNDAVEDPDGDSYTNLAEYTAGTDPQDANDYPGSSTGTDTDGDNTPDDTDTDDDNDGMPDTWEDQYGLKPKDASDAAADNDGDTYTNKQEYDAGTDPTDQTSYPGSGTSPDTDGDNTPDDTDTDDDNDGMPDTFENQYGLKPKDASDASEDKDGDGFTNKQEYDASTNPTDASDKPSTGPVGKDPAIETATDSSVSVNIDKASYSIKEEGEKYRFEMQVTGTTSGADHCQLAFVGYYDDGSFDDISWMDPIDWEDNAMMKQMLEQAGYTAMHFKKTSDNWKSWELKMTGSVDKTSDEGKEIGETHEDTTKMTKFVVYVRAYSDAGETKWNQDSKEIEGIGTTKKSDKDDSTPGFEALVLIAALGVLFITYRRRKQ